MPKSLFEGTKQAARIAARDPEGAAAAAVALDRFTKTGEFLVLDSLLESRLAPALEATQGIDTAVVFGFRDHLRLLLVMSVKGEPFEVLCSLQPHGCSWGPDYWLSFEFEILRWECLGRKGKIAATGLRQAIGALIPFGGIVNALGAVAVDQAVKQMGVARLNEWSGLNDRGVSISGQVATVDLRAQPELAPLWSAKVASPGGLLQMVANAVGAPTQAAQLFSINSTRADREGLYLAASLSPIGTKMFEATAGAGSAVQSKVAGLLGGDPERT
jgi:stage V sporulation protein SpoVS